MSLRTTGSSLFRGASASVRCKLLLIISPVNGVCIVVNAFVRQWRVSCSLPRGESMRDVGLRSGVRSTSPRCFRYLGAAYIISTSVLFFSRNFTIGSCTSIVPLYVRHRHRLSRLALIPAFLCRGGFFRGTVSTTSALIFLWRTWAIWQRNRVCTVTVVSHPSHTLSC